MAQNGEFGFCPGRKKKIIAGGTNKIVTYLGNMDLEVGYDIKREAFLLVERKFSQKTNITRKSPDWEIM